MDRRRFLAAWVGASPALGAPARLSAAAFRADATPPLGAPLIWVTPAVRIADPLWAKGVVLASQAGRMVLCAVDWCGISGSWHALLRRRIAAAVGASPSMVAVQTVHQHTAPYVCGDAYALLRQKFAKPPLLYPEREFFAMADRIAAAARTALAEAKPVTHLGYAEVEVERVASERRLLDPGGKKVIAVRYSTTAKTPALALAPEGEVDRRLKTITLFSARKPLVRLHYYATHPQTFCCDGVVSGDFVSAARETFEKEEGAPQVYFTGCAGNVTVGKYNDGSDQARRDLAARMLAAFRAAPAATQEAPVAAPSWKSVPLTLPLRSENDPVFAAHTAKLESRSGVTDQDLYRSAIAVAFHARRTPLEVTALALGRVVIVHLPGEPMLDFQRYAQGIRPDHRVVTAGYGDIGPGYLCTDAAYQQGGYEPGASNVAPGTEGALKAALRAAVLGKNDA